METVLIVEDEVTTRDALIELLGKEGREIVTAADGQEAMDCLTMVPRPRVILLDLMMPRMDGWEFLRRQATDPSIAISLPSYCPAPSYQLEQSTS